MIEVMIFGYSWKRCAVGVTLLAMCFAAGSDVGTIFSKSDCNSSYRFINEQFWCPGSSKIKKYEYSVVRNNISIYLQGEEALHHLHTASVYFRDLADGPTFGIDENNKFIPASLLKVPLMLTYFRLSESDPSLFKKEIRFSAQGDRQEQFFSSPKPLEEKVPYSIRELLFRMIAYSDNDAHDLLQMYLEKISTSTNELLETYHDLGIIDPRSNIEETLSTKTYASIFRGLYNASYLSAESSEKAISMLSASYFNGGIVAAVPRSIPVAHKFGERGGLDGGVKQLHDCGIIYYPENPFLLCIMTEGYDFPTLLSVIQHISKLVYEEVDSRKIN